MVVQMDNTINTAMSQLFMEIQMNAPLNLASTSIDTLGTLLAQIAELTKQADAIKDSLKEVATSSDNAPNVFEGALFKATVISANRSTIDYKALFSALNITEEMVKPFVKTTAVFSVKTTSK